MWDIKSIVFGIARDEKQTDQSRFMALQSSIASQANEPSPADVKSLIHMAEKLGIGGNHDERVQIVTDDLSLAREASELQPLADTHPARQKAEYAARDEKFKVDEIEAENIKRSQAKIDAAAARYLQTKNASGESAGAVKRIADIKNALNARVNPPVYDGPTGNVICPNPPHTTLADDHPFVTGKYQNDDKPWIAGH